MSRATKLRDLAPADEVCRLVVSAEEEGLEGRVVGLEPFDRTGDSQRAGSGDHV